MCYNLPDVLEIRGTKFTYFVQYSKFKQAKEKSTFEPVVYQNGFICFAAQMMY